MGLRARTVRSAVLVGVLTSAVAACGGGDKKDTPNSVPGKTVSGETETGMKLKVETFLDPSKDPAAKKIEAWRAAMHYPAVDYHRVTADNSSGSVADSGRVLRFARDANEIAAGKAVEARFSCDALEFEWLPTDASKNNDWNALRKDVCADGPPKPEGIAPGAKKVYFLVTDRNFAARGLRSMKVFGPRDLEFK
jgi:hypothetical protein